MKTCALQFYFALPGLSIGQSAHSLINGILREGRLEAGDAQRIRLTNV
jgi:hypothetical protein